MKKIALVLSGGGARGFAHVGVIRELKEAGYSVSSIAGTSMGAVVGAAQATDKLDEFEDWITSLDRRRVFQLLDFTMQGPGFVRGERVLNEVRDFIPDVPIEDLDVPFAAVAVDLHSRQEVVFREGPLFNAIRASISIPTVMTPLELNEKLLVDGGVMNNLPVDRVKRTDDDILVAVNVGAKVQPISLPEEYKDQKGIMERYAESMERLNEWLQGHGLLKADNGLSFFELISETLELIMDTVVDLRLKTHEPDLLINISKDTCGTFDFYRAEELIEIGRIACRQHLDKLKDQ